MASHKRRIAAEAWRGIFDFVVATAGQRQGLIKELGISPGDARALASLETGESQTMRSLAETWRCDPSTVTWIVDRLEARGLTTRRLSSKDRRIKHVVLTNRGEQIKNKLSEKLRQPPPQLLELKLSDLIAIRDAAAKLPKTEKLLPPPGIEGE